jgi:superfamily II DNA/RNA helicase
MAADSTILVTKEEPGYSTKLAYLDDLFERLFEEEGRKVIVFSEWTTMLGLVEKLLRKRNLSFVRLDGSIPQKDRPALVERFQNDPECKLFLSTNAGSTGLNLQSANTVINVDLPWNPAILEQRIARAHRMGQVQPVQVYVLVTEQTIEENLLRTIAAKKDLALAALDVDSEVEKVDLVVGMDELKSRLEVLLGAKAEAPVDESKRQEVVDTTQRDRVASAGGELLGAAIKFLGELAGPSVAPPDAVVAQVRRGLDACVEKGADGRAKLSFTLPDASTLDGLTQALARLVAAAGGR